MTELGHLLGSIEHWAFFIISSGVAFLCGRALATGRRVSCALESSKRIPELLDATAAVLRLQKRSAIYLKYAIRLQLVCAVPPQDVDAVIRRIQTDLTDELEELR